MTYRFRTIRIIAIRLLVLSLFGVAGAPALATEGAGETSVSDASAWTFRTQIYGWFPAIAGETVFPPPASGGNGTGVGIDAADYMRALEFAFMGSLEVRKGRIGALVDVIYLNFEAGESATRDLTLTGPGGLINLPAGVTADAELGLSGWVWTMTGTYSAIETSRHNLQLLGGWRYLSVKASFDWDLSGNLADLPPQSASGKISADPEFWDAIVGVRGRLNWADGAWFTPYHLDIGSGESDLTWQAVAGIGYAFSWGELIGVYRHLDYRLDSDSAVKDLSFGGPAVSVAFRW